MLFNSWTFLFFAIAVFALYYVLPFRWQNRMLLVASYVFYGAWDWRFLGLLLISTVVDYYVSTAMVRQERQHVRRLILMISIAMNLGFLGFFKYFGFFVDSFNVLLHAAGLSAIAGRLDIVLPVGISFYTFQSLSYTIDVYRRQAQPARSLEDFALFVAYFPQLMAGPISRAADLLPQLTHPRTPRRSQMLEGAWLILYGLFLKVVVADNLAPHVARVFDPSYDPTGLECLLATYAFAFQIYADFSGYSNMARGLSKLMGIELVVNFRLPYLATSPSDFWRRWHISLSTWLRDYLYITFGGNRGSPWHTYRNLMLTMILGGLWHGAAWNFVVWGFYQGLILVLQRLWVEYVRPPAPGRGESPVTHALKVAGMFQLTCIGWLIFRATSFGQIVEFLAKIATDLRVTAPAAQLLFAVLLFPALVWAVESYVRNADDPRIRPFWTRGAGPAVVTGLLAALVYLAAPAGQDFIYFQF
jgi:alginate O-acetyltransferase complex protein AlgI